MKRGVRRGIENNMHKILIRLVQNYSSLKVGTDDDLCPIYFAGCPCKEVRMQTGDHRQPFHWKERTTFFIHD